MDRMPTEEELQQLDLEEHAQKEGAKLTPIDYAKLRRVRPQLIYYHIRNGHLEIEYCGCGRKTLDVAKADAYFQEKARERRGVVDTRADQERSE